MIGSRCARAGGPAGYRPSVHPHRARSPSSSSSLLQPNTPAQVPTLVGALVPRPTQVLATHHAATLTQLDLTGCSSLSCTRRPLEAIRRLTHLEHLRLPAEKWREHELADCLAALPRLTAVDSSTRADLTRERDALRMQCEILGHVQH